jgi:hypothetical protein
MAIMTRAQQGAEQLLGAAGLGEDAVSGVSEAIVQAATREAEASRPPELPTRPEPIAAAPEPEAQEPEPDRPSQEQGGDEETGPPGS